MPSLEDIRRDCLSFFLCSFDPRSKRKKISTIVSEYLSTDYSDDLVSRFIDQRITQLQSDLVDEFNERYIQGRPLRFRIVDSAATGSVLEGFKASSAEVRFQSLLYELSDEEFETLAAVLLRCLGCTAVYSTPTSHDQGVDAFGTVSLVDPVPYGTTHKLTWIAQAKHYRSIKISTGDLRELVGSTELLIAKVFSTVDERYRELKLRVYAPTALALVTSEEMPHTVRRLAESAGIYVFGASDIYHMLKSKLRVKSLRNLKALLVREKSSITKLT